MLKENKEYFFYIFLTIFLILGFLIVIDLIIPGQITTNKCGFLSFKCWFTSESQLKTYKEPPKLTINQSKNYTAVFKTTMGDFEIDLFEKNALNTVNNFIFLSKEGYYNGVKIHRVVKDFLFQTGDANTLDKDKNNDGKGGPGYVINDEINWESLSFSNAKIQQLQSLGYSSTPGIISEPMKKGSVCMANSGPNSNGSQFFIITAASDDPFVKGLEGKHTVFGEVISGWGVIEKINNVEVDDPNSSSPKPKKDIKIIEIIINEI